MGDTGCQFAQRRKFTCLYQLFLLLPQFLLAVLDLLCCLFQIAHDVDHGLTAVLQAQIGLVRVLQDVQ